MADNARTDEGDAADTGKKQASDENLFRRTATKSVLDKRSDQTSAWIELFKLEYGKAADRYENIYKAIWQNFSYMAVVAAAILTFAAKQLPGYFTTALVLAPIAFWYLATYVPMDFYGQDTRRRMADIESQLNDTFFPNEGDPQLIHYTNFRNPENRLRVRYVVHPAGVITLIVIVVSVILGCIAPPTKQEPNGFTVKATPDSMSVVLSPHRQLQSDSIAVLAGLVRQLGADSRDVHHALDSLRLEISKLPKR